MIKLSASLCKKVPIAGMNYSSQSFLAGLEVELSDAAAPPEVQQRIREVYQLLEASINEQIAAHQNNTERERPAIRPASVYPRGQNGNGPVRERSGSTNDNTPYPVSRAQLKAIRSIAQEQGLDDTALGELLRQRFHRQAVDDLTMREASRLITLLKESRAA